MRALSLILAGGLSLLISACGGDSNGGRTNPEGVTPVSKYNELIVGRWQNIDESEFIQSYEFAPEDTLKMTVKGMAEPFSARYRWAGDRQLEFEFEASDQVKKRYTAAVNAYKEPIRKRLGEGKLDGRAATGMKISMDAVADQVPVKQTIQVILSEKPREVLLLSTESTKMTLRRTRE